MLLQRPPNQSLEQVHRSHQICVRKSAACLDHCSRIHSDATKHAGNKP